VSDHTIGQSVPRIGARERVSGAQKYTADLPFPGALHVQLVHLDAARLAIRKIRRDAALRVPGVVAILGAEDLPDPMPRFGPAAPDRPLLADGETRFFGEPVAAVAAETLDGAREAAMLLRAHLDAEELPPVLTVEHALDPSSPLVQRPETRPNDRYAQTNILREWTFGWGTAPERVHLVVEHEYRFPMVTHFAIEPHAFAAAPDESGVTIWSPTQHPFVLQRVVAACLGLPLARVRIVAPDPGGGFGGKGWPKFEPLLAYMALRLGRPVRLVLTLEESFQAARRTSARIQARTAFDSDGHILSQDLRTDFLVGAYADIGIRVVSKASYAACGPYRTPHAAVHARALLSHTTPSTAFRGFGTPQASWAVESQLNEAARTLGIDAVEIRRRNLPRKGEAFIPGDTPADGDWGAALAAAERAIGWHTPLAPGRGRGISLGLKSSSTASASLAIVRLLFDGSVSVFSATSDMGQGARTVLAQIAGRELGVSPDRIVLTMGDTAVVPFDSSTSASRSTVFMGNAIVRACGEIRAQLRRLAARAYDVSEASVSVEPGVVRVADRQLAYPEVLRDGFGPPRGELVGVGEDRGGGFRADHPLGGRPEFWEFMCSAVEVEVDAETGVVDVTRLILASDVGKALNPQQVEGQDEGAAMMGIGHSLMEELILDQRGRVRNLGALDYRVPTTMNMPRELHSILIENEDGPGPYGAKGAGEGGILGIAAAVGAAVHQATGVQIRELPLTPERIWRAIRQEHQRNSALKD
jgi:CO/xanthine dehydrogenase Mo-binding subunit